MTYEIKTNENRCELHITEESKLGLVIGALENELSYTEDEIVYNFNQVFNALTGVNINFTRAKLEEIDDGVIVAKTAVFTTAELTHLEHMCCTDDIEEAMERIELTIHPDVVDKKYFQHFIYD